MSNLEKSVSEAILQSIDILVDKKLSELEYNKTIKANIIDASKASQGVYECRYETSTFNAYTTDTSLKNGDLVQVLISNNDSSETRVIINKLVEDDADYLSNNEFSKYIDVTNNIVQSFVNTNKSLVANGPVEEQLVWGYSGTLDFSKYTKLNLEASFQTMLQTAVEGSFGLRVEIVHDDQFLNLTFNNKEMLGNPYYYIGATPQRKIFDLSKYNIKNISSIQLVLYQEQGSFIDDSGNTLSARDSLGNILPGNIFMTDPVISFGFFNEELVPGVDSVTIELAEGYKTSYKVEPDKAVVNLHWLHWNEDNSQILLNEEIENYTIKWYQYQVYAEAVAAIAKQRTVGEGPFEGIVGDDALNLIEDNLISKLGCPYIDNNNWQPLADFENDFSCEVTLDGDFATQEQVRAFVFVDESKIFQSNILTFVNENNANEKDDVVEQGAFLEIDDDLDGNYYLYTESGILNHEDKKTRVIKVSYYTPDGEQVDLVNNENYTITWDYPVENSMIAAVEPGADLTELIFSIEKIYNPTATNNSISCTITYNNDNFSYHDYTVTKELLFGYSNVSNEGVNLLIAFNEPILINNSVRFTNNAISTEESSAEFILKKYNEKGALEDLSNANIQWELITYNVANGEEQSTDVPLIITQSENSSDIATLETTGEGNFTFDYFIYLKASICDDNDRPLYSVELPVPVTTDKMTNNYISGATEVIYRTIGIPIYNKEPYTLYDYNGNKQDVNWQYDSGHWDEWYTLDSNGCLLPSQIYLEDHKAIGVKAIQEEDNSIVWLQPISTSETQFSSTLLNKWDGKSVSTEGSAVLAPMIAAGKKENVENEDVFTGVILGDWAEDTNNAIPLTGLYGFHQGVSSFGFMENGIGFIGKQGLGRIQFDGTRGLISSGDFKTPAENNTVYYSGTSWIDLKSDGLPINENESLIVKFDDNFKVDSNGNVNVKGNITADSFRGNTDIGIGQIDSNNGTRLSNYNFQVNGNGEVSVKGNITADSFRGNKDIGIGQIDSNNGTENLSNYNFYVRENGEVNVKGNITADKFRGNKDFGIGQIDSNNGTENLSNYNFYVTSSGTVYTKGMQVNGSLELDEENGFLNNFYKITSYSIEPQVENQVRTAYIVKTWDEKDPYDLLDYGYHKEIANTSRPIFYNNPAVSADKPWSNIYNHTYFTFWINIGLFEEKNPMLYVPVSFVRISTNKSRAFTISGFNIYTIESTDEPGRFYYRAKIVIARNEGVTVSPTNPLKMYFKILWLKDQRFLEIDPDSISDTSPADEGEAADENVSGETTTGQIIGTLVSYSESEQSLILEVLTRHPYMVGFSDIPSTFFTTIRNNNLQDKIVKIIYEGPRNNPTNYISIEEYNET